MSIVDTLGLRRKPPPNEYNFPASSNPEGVGAGGMEFSGELGISANLGASGGSVESGSPGSSNISAYDLVEAGALVDEVNREYTRRQKERQGYELQWKLNLAFIEGNQYTDINYVSQALFETMPDHDWEQREVFNHIAHNVETRISRLGKMKPILKTRPGSNEASDMRRTKVSSQLLQNTYYDKRVEDLMSAAITWVEYTGTVLFKNYWNPSAGPIISWPQQLPDGSQTVVDVQEGDLSVIVCPPQEIFPNSNYCQDVSDCESIIHARIYSVKAIKEIWGKEVMPEASAAKQLQQTMLGRGGQIGPGGYSGPEISLGELKDYAVVKEFWEIPSSRYPEGRLIIVAGNTLLAFSPLPYKVGPDMTLALPFTKCVCINRPGVFWGKTVLERLIPLQRRYNALRNRKAEYLTSCAIGNWLVEEESIVDMDGFEANVGRPEYVVIVRKGTTVLPQKVTNSSLPTAFDTEEYTLLQEFSILSGVSEMSRQSKAPAGVKSGVAISLSLEQDETRLSLVAENLKKTLIQNGAQWLRLYRQYVKAPRLLKYVNRNDVVDVYEWLASDLKSEDVILDSYSALSESPSQKRQMVFDLLGTGLFADPDTGRVDRNTRNRILEMLQFTDWEGADNEDEMHIARAERENRSMSEGQMVYPAEYDNHLLHVQKHDIFRVSVDYEGLVAENPFVAQAFQLHTQLHIMAYTQSIAGLGLDPNIKKEAKGQSYFPEPSSEEQTGETSQARSAQTKAEEASEASRSGAPTMS